MDGSILTTITRPAILTFLLGAVILLVFRRYAQGTRPKSTLEVRGSFLKDDLREVLRKGFVEDPNTAYAIQLPGRTTVVVPIGLKQEYGWLTDDHASASEDLYDRSFGRYTGFGSYTPHLPGDPIMVNVNYAKGPLTKHINPTLKYMYEEIDYALGREVGTPTDFKEYGAHHLASRIAARVMQRVYVGTELSRNENWLKACSTIGMTIPSTARALASYSPWLRPIAKYRSKEVRAFHDSQREIDSFLKSLHEKCLSTGGDAADIEPSNLVNYYVNIPGNARKKNTLNLGTALVGTNFAGITSVGFVLHELFLDLAAYPDLADELREEIKSVRKEMGTDKLLQAGINKLVKMDSFIKESLRHNSASFFSMTRKIKTDLRLSNGQTIPANSYVVVPGSLNDRISLVEGSKDGFDPMRWYRMRQAAKDKDPNFYSWVSAGNDTMGFGYGVHACPGRFFATVAVKTIVSVMLMRYEFALTEGDKRKGPEISPWLERKFDFVSKVQLKLR